MISEKNGVFELSNSEISYILRVNEYGFLENVYFGKKIEYTESIKNSTVGRGHEIHPAGYPNAPAIGNFAFEYSTPFRGDYRTHAIGFSYEKSGIRGDDFKYSSYRTIEKDFSSPLPKCRGGQTLEITLKSTCGLEVKLFYTVYDDVNAVVRSALIENFSNGAVELNRAYSFNLDMPNDDYDLSGLFGAYLRERNIEKSKLTRGIKTIDSKRGESSAIANPFVALSTFGATEEKGDVYAFNLIYSGNFEFNVELDEFDGVRVNGGVSSFDFGYRLDRGESFETPEVALVFSDGGFGKASRTFHDLYREYLINENFVKKPRPIVINNWEVTAFDFTEEKLKRLADVAAETGMDALVLDDGWFGNRNDDTTSLGDWYINEKRLPNGLKPVSDYCHKKGLKFGLWFEPEMISPVSNLISRHPEWAVRSPDVTPCLGRNQLTIDFSNPDVTDYIIDIISSHVVNDGLDYIKWDMNRPMSEYFSSSLGSERQKEFSYRYILGLYKTLKTITERFPNLLIEGCAAGGCRFDAGILRYCPQIWTSDDTDAFYRENIQYGTSFCYPLSTISNHVSASPNHQTGRSICLESRANVALLGVLGYELDITKFNESEKNAVRQINERYKKDCKLILEGDLYRYNKEGLKVETVVSKDKKQALLKAVYGLKGLSVSANRVKLVGLSSDKKYKVVETGEIYYGSALINRGFILPQAKVDFDTFIFRFEQTE